VSYDRSAEARRLPLRRIAIDRPPEDIRLKAPVRYTPTFVAIDDGGAEVGRITGYSGDDSFWGQLGALLRKLPSPHGN
jgi:hypothetical protein